MEPRDGIDDRRNGVLSSPAVRFAPVLVQNTGDFPMGFRVFIEPSATPESRSVSTPVPRWGGGVLLSA